MASNATSTPSAAAAGPPRSAASVAFTPPMSTGTSSGSSRTGSITSRDRARTVMAAKSVASAAKPRLPSASTSRSRGSTLPTSTCRSTATSGSTIACMTPSRTTFDASLPRYSAAGSSGDASTPPRQSFSRSRTNPRWMPRSPVKTNVAHSTLGARRGACSGVGSKATLKTTTRRTPSTTKPARLSFVRHSMRRSLRRTASMPRSISSAPSGHDRVVGCREHDGIRGSVSRPGDAPAMQDGHARRDRGDALDVVRAEHDGVSGPPQLREQRLETGAGGGIEPAEGLVEEEQLRPVQQRPCQRQPLHHAARVDAYRSARRLFEPRPAQQLRDAGLRVGHPVELGVEPEVLPSGQVRIAGALVTDVPDSPARGRRAPAGVLAEEPERAAARAQQGREHAEQRRLAGAVRAQQDDQLARVDGEVDAGQHWDPAELAAQALGDDRRPDQSPTAPRAPRMTASRTTARATAPPRPRRPGRRGAPARRGRRSTPRAAC